MKTTNTIETRTNKIENFDLLFCFIVAFGKFFLDLEYTYPIINFFFDQLLYFEIKILFFPQPCFSLFLEDLSFLNF